MLPSKAKPELYSVLDDLQENFNVARKPENAEVLEKELCKLKNKNAVTPHSFCKNFPQWPKGVEHS